MKRKKIITAGRQAEMETRSDVVKSGYQNSDPQKSYKNRTLRRIQIKKKQAIESRLSKRRQRE
jgi:hypothetical protein